MKIAIRPTTGLTGATEYFWTIVRDGRLLDSGIEGSEAEAIAVASDSASRIVGAI